MNNKKQHGGPRIPGPGKQLGRMPKPPHEKGTLLKAYPPYWLYVIVQTEAKQTGKSQSEIIIEALKQRYTAP